MNAEQTKKNQEIIAKFWSDEAFKQLLLSNPREALKQLGIEPPSEVTVHLWKTRLPN